MPFGLLYIALEVVGQTVTPFPSLTPSQAMRK